MEVLLDGACAIPSLRDSLKQATAARHRRLDAMFGRIAEPGSELYRRFIAMNHACHRAIEPLLLHSPLTGLVPQWPSWSRLPALRLDMAEMKLSPLRMPAFPLACPDLSQAVGISYVVEGSRLGAALILRQLQAIESDHESSRTYHYLRHGAREGHFRNLMAAVSTLDWNDRSLARAGEAADATFDYFLLAASRTEGVRR